MTCIKRTCHSIGIHGRKFLALKDVAGKLVVRSIVGQCHQHLPSLVL